MSDEQKIERPEIDAEFVCDIIADQISEISNNVDGIKDVLWNYDCSEAASKALNGVLDCLYKHAEEINNWRIKDGKAKVPKEA